MPPARLGGTGCPQPQPRGLGPCPVPASSLGKANSSLAENALKDADVHHLEAAPAQGARCGLETAF